MLIFKKYNKLFSFDKIILYFSLFYYSLYNMYSGEISGKYLYSFLILFAICYLIIKTLNINYKIDKLYLAFIIAFIYIVLFLYFSVSNFFDEKHRLNTAVSMYLGVFLFLVFFYSSMRCSDYTKFAPIKILFWILISSIFIEFIYINFFKGISDFIFYYKIEDKKITLDNIKILGYSPAHGLLGMRQMSGTLLVALFWLSRTFDGKRGLLNIYIIMLFIALILSLSGTSMILFLLSVFYYVNKNIKIIASIIIIALLLTLENSGWFSKISSEYILIVLTEVKFKQITDFMTLLANEPLSILIGGNISVSSDFSILKLVADIGVLPLMLNIFFLLAIMKRSYRVLTDDGYKNVKIAILIIFLATFHYPLLFTVVVQALLAYLFVMFVKCKKIMHKDSKTIISD